MVTIGARGPATATTRTTRPRHDMSSASHTRAVGADLQLCDVILPTPTREHGAECLVHDWHAPCQATIKHPPATHVAAPARDQPPNAT